MEYVASVAESRLVFLSVVGEVLLFFFQDDEETPIEWRERMKRRVA